MLYWYIMDRTGKWDTGSRPVRVLYRSPALCFLVGIWVIECAICYPAGYYTCTWRMRRHSRACYGLGPACSTPCQGLFQ